MLKNDFLKYSVKDFLLDESFQREIIQEGSHPAEIWTDLLKEHPEKRATVEEAQMIMLQLKSQFDGEFTSEDIREVWTSIEASIDR